jgi:hypothetical protein
VAEWSKAPDLGSGLIEAWVQTPPPSSFSLLPAFVLNRGKRIKDEKIVERKGIPPAGIEPATLR